MGKERVAKWDNLKFVLIAFVVIGHSIATYAPLCEPLLSLYMFIYTFHMPAFILISGMMLQNTVKNKRYEKLFPYFTMGMIIKLLQFVVKWFVLGRHRLNFFDVDDVSWYAFAVFVFALATMYLKRFKATYIIIFTIAIALAVGYDKRIGTYLTLSRIFVFYPFFLAGFYIDREKLLSFTSKPVMKAISGVIAAIMAGICYFRVDLVYKFLPLLKGKEAYRSLGELRDWGAPLRLAAYAVMFIMSFAVITLVPNIKSYFTTLGARTLSVYTLHFPLIYILRDGLGVVDAAKSFAPEHYMYFSLILALVILFVTSLKPVHIAVSKLINPALAKTEEKK